MNVLLWRRKGGTIYPLKPNNQQKEELMEKEKNQKEKN